MDTALADRFDPDADAVPMFCPNARMAAAIVSPPRHEPAGRFGARSGPNWVAIVAIGAAHALLLWALVSFDVIQVKQTPRAPLVVTLLPEPSAPPERPHDVEAKVTPAAPPLLAPPPIVETTQPDPPIVVDRVMAPLVPVVVAVAAPVAATPVAATVVPPTPLAGKSNTAPKYPIEARRRKWEGTVRLRVLVSTDGSVKDITVAHSSGHDALDEAALAAVGRWKFRPATQNGAQVEAVGYLNIPFELKA